MWQGDGPERKDVARRNRRPLLSTTSGVGQPVRKLRSPHRKGMPLVDPTISVLAHIDVDGAYVHLVVTGHLTEANQQGLHPLVRQARALAPDGAISVDLRGAENVEDNAVESLRWVTDHSDDTGPAAGSVDILVPNQVSNHEFGTAPAVEATA